MKDLFLLDMDDTLLDFGQAERENLLKTLRMFGIEADERLISRYHKINEGLWKALERGELARETLLVRRFELLLREYGFSADPRAVAAAFFENFPEICYPFVGAEEFLKTLKNRGRVYICTNGSAKIQRRHIALGGFAPYLDGVFISEETGFDKPSEGYVNFVRTHIPRFSADGAVYFGDSLTSDLVCAERLGATFVLFAPRGVPAGYEGASAKTYSEALAFL